MKAIFSVCVVTVLFILFVYADDFLDSAKKIYEFDKWQGRDGALKQGILMKEVNLSPYEVISERSRLRTSGETILRYGLKASRKIVFEVSIFVGDSILEAQEALLRFLSTCTVTIPNGSTAGITVGDVCFAAKDGNTVALIAFTRNNVFIRLSLLKVDETSPDITEIAKKIDERIKQEEEAKDAQDLKKPLITDFSVAKDTTAPDTPVEVTFKTEGDGLYVEIDEGGGMVYDDGGKKYFKAQNTGEYKVTVYVRNERFLVSKRTITIKVE
jgi:hypothetical protein